MADYYYKEIFEQNGASYHHAMKTWPRVRDEEFAAALSYLKGKGGKILDVPAGGGYLKAYLPDGWSYLGKDFSGGFGTSHNLVVKCSEIDLGVPASSFDAVICLAAMHHVENKEAFFNAVKKALKPDGIFLIGDVIKDTKEAEFLNGFVNDWNSLGHDGDFIDQKRDMKLLQDYGFKSDYKRKDYHWNFDDKHQAFHYFRHLFTLNKNPSDDQLEKAIEKLETSSCSHHFRNQWSLGFIEARLM